ncbi:hypothetical protein ANN_10564 [Periplaneta americana]|uniref:Uncharacterized protein n=1 Tax=Periplaneta americana TaxID=6978 RepID=A0ABQ8TRN4_PERAM|nr:hypothetical protein ANN_10564 [Periplaneta americana]
MAGLCEGGNEPSGSLKAICKYPQNVDEALNLRCHFGDQQHQIIVLDNTADSTNNARGKGSAWRGVLSNGTYVGVQALFHETNFAMPM